MTCRGVPKREVFFRVNGKFRIEQASQGASFYEGIDYRKPARPKPGHTQKWTGIMEINEENKQIINQLLQELREARRELEVRLRVMEMRLLNLMGKSTPAPKVIEINGRLVRVGSLADKR